MQIMLEHIKDLAFAASAAEVEISTAWQASSKEAAADAVSAEGHGAAASAARAADRAERALALGRKAEARALLERGWKAHAMADEAVAWLRQH